MLCALWVTFFAGPFDYYVIDLSSFPIPILRCRNRKVLYYCHYPDKLLCTNRRGYLMKAYRCVLDSMEEVTTGMAHTTLVNSKFTQGVYQRNFPLVLKYFPNNSEPKVLYPAINDKNFLQSPDYTETLDDLLQRPIAKNPDGSRATRILTSLNRYSRDKNIRLALYSFARYIEEHAKESGQSDDETVMVIAGGYDDRLLENVEHHLELVAIAHKLHVSDKVVFLRSISNDQRLLLLQNTDIMLYTPENEHFGIVPVEAMHLGCVVIACNSGGPLESIVHKKTGFLEKPEPSLWADRIKQILNGESILESDS
jgi:alpha-1,3/alpha-1,6-mannosyltransferase